MKLITYNNFELNVTPEALLISPIRKLFNKDKTKGKEMFWKQMSYLYFMEDPTSVYSYITDREDRSKVIITQEGLPEDFKPSEDLSNAMEWYRKTTITSSSLLLEDTRIAIDKVRDFLRTVDLSAVDDKGKPIFPVNTITSAIKQIPELAKSLSEAEKAVQKELQDSERVRGGIDKNIFEDGIKLS